MIRWLLILSLFALGPIGCVTPAAQRARMGPVLEEARSTVETPGLRPSEIEPYPAPSNPPPPASDGRGSRLAQWAATFVGLRSLRQVTHTVTDDCSGFVRFVYQRQGIELYDHGFLPGENGVSAIYRRAHAVGAVHKENPRPGDLVFFHDTYDRNHNGRFDGKLTHIGIVESVDAKGTVTFIHRHGPGISRSRFNPLFPAVRQDPDGEILNDWLRRPSRRQRAYFAGELLSGYASPDRP